MDYSESPMKILIKLMEMDYFQVFYQTILLQNIILTLTACVPRAGGYYYFWTVGQVGLLGWSIELYRLDRIVLEICTNLYKAQSITELHMKNPKN